MKKRNAKFGSMDLGKELSKNSQKEIIGGATIYCSNGCAYYVGNCSPPQLGYCSAAGHGTTVACYG